MKLSCNLKLATALALALWVSGCATIGEMAGVDSHWGRIERVSKQGEAYAWHLTGIIYERQAEVEHARDAFHAVNARDPEAVAPRLRMIRLHLRQGEYEEALALCETALEYAPEKAELWVVYGELSHRLGHIEEAIRSFNKAIELRPDDLLGYGALVELQESTNDLVAAIDIYERLIERSPDSAALYYQLGINLARINDFAYARTTFEKVLALEPRIIRARFLLALVLFEMGEFARSAEEFRLYLAERPDDVTATEYRVGALVRINRLEQARRILEQLILDSGVSARQYLQMAWILLQMGQAEEAQPYVLEGGAYFFADIIQTLALFESLPDEKRLDQLWDDRYVIEEIEQESDLLLSAIVALFGVEPAGSALLDMLHRFEAEAGFSPASAFVRARLLLHMDRHAEAIEVLEKICAASVTSRHLHYYLAIAYEHLNQYDEVEYHLEAYLAIAPDDADVLNFFGYFYAERNMKLDKAEALLNKALKIDPENPYYLDSLGWIYYRQGKAEEAAELIRRAIYGMDTDDAVLRDHLGDVYLHKGDLKRALDEWRRALRLDGSLDDVRRKIDFYAPVLDDSVSVNE